MKVIVVIGCYLHKSTSYLCHVGLPVALRAVRYHNHCWECPSLLHGCTVMVRGQQLDTS